jgi:sulfatase-like protein
VRAVNVRLSSPTVAVPAAWHLAAQVQGPDMYVLLADGHGRGDVMANGYGEDETELRSTLTSLGFDEAMHSRANHVLTRFSVSVLFNGRPMSEMGQDLSRPVDEALPFAALRTSGASPLLRSAGYRVIVIGSGFEHLGLRGVDTFIDVGPRNEMEEVMLEGTALGQAIDKLTAGYVHDVYTRTLHELDTMTSIARQPAGQPRFVFAHLPAPHWPMVFNADCSFRPVDHYTRAADDRGYRKADASGLRIERDQTACVDTLLAKTVNDVVAADPDAVVIVLSDHGPEEKLDWTAPDEPGLSDRFANLFWARTPGKPGLFPDDITLVNVLPILFNSYLGSDLPLHPNDLWFGPAPGNDRFVRYTPPAL